MTIQPIVRLGTEKLSQPSAIITEFNTPELQQLLKDMHETMLEKNGVGIAAPQIGVYVRVVMFGFQKNERYPDAEPVPFTILINPTFEPLSDETVEDWEGCLSIPGLRGLVTRYKKIKYSGYDEKGQFFSRKVKDFHARVVQHELDHIDGSLFPERMKDMKMFGFEDLIWERVVKWREEHKL